MSKLKSPILFLICFAVFVSALIPPISAQPVNLPTPSISAQSAVLIEAESGERAYQKSADMPLPMASTTKIMTAVVALEIASPTQIITVSPEAVGTEGSSVYLTEGEQLTLEQLLYALLLESANDAAIAIAIGTAGSVEEFCRRMNQKAEALSLESTHFSNPHGLDDPEHYTTASDLAMLTRYALQNELFSKIVSTRKTTIPHAGVDGVRLLVNHNKLLRLSEECIGVKTGFTTLSGRCLVSAAKRDGVTLIAVTLNAPNDWNDHLALFEYGFSHYEHISLCTPDSHRVPLSIVNGTDGYVLLCNMQAFSRTLPATHGRIRTTLELRRFEYAPIAEGEIYGRAVFFCDIDSDGTDEEIGSVPLYAAYSVEKAMHKKSFWQWLCSLFGF